MREKNIDLTSGVIWRKLLIFCLPLLLSSLFQQLYTTVDAIIVGQFVGKNGLAAVDSVYNFLKLPVNFFLGLSTGATIIISQHFGAKNKKELSEAVHTAIAFSFTGGLLLSVLGIVLAPYFLYKLEIPEDIYPITLDYVRIYFGGLAVSMLYNIGAGIVRAMGDSKTPFYYLLISSTVNILTDLLFVGVFRWGVSGAALSTILAQAVSAVLIIRFLMNTDMDCRLHIKSIKFYPKMLKAIFKVGIPIGLQASLYPIANMMIQANINSMGTDNIAAWALCGKLDFLIWIIVDSLASAISTFVAQNFGAGKYDRIFKGVRVGLIMTLAIIFIISANLFFFSEPMGKLFINPADYDIIPITGKLMRFLSPLYFLYVFGDVLSGAIRGTGETVKPMLLTLIGTCMCRILWILIVVPKNRNMMTIIGSYPVSWFVTALFFIGFYCVFKKKMMQVSYSEI